MGAVSSCPCMEGLSNWALADEARAKPIKVAAAAVVRKGGNEAQGQHKISTIIRTELLPKQGYISSVLIPRRGLQAWPKTLLLVRHGQSTYNVQYEQTKTDPMNLWDAPLTQMGEEQARALQGRFADLVCPVELALTSPLTRAMQTGLLAMPVSSRVAAGRYEVSPLFAEHLEASCDIGRPPSELKADFPEMSFEGLEEVWWYVPQECQAGISVEKSRKLFSEEGRREPPRTFEARVDAAAASLAKRQEQVIAVFAHADFFNTLLRRHFASRDASFNDYWMKNCEVRGAFRKMRERTPATEP
ncbi:unnamed protein product [Polarella glacialis]|uniref:Phosphoglycerate mutase n=1 Tax=Polarella glacialis TaxID=89957 RepID=A0A813L2P7_POLGL|nr:unnamed protein product [Polarella glacialis]